MSAHDPLPDGWDTCIQPTALEAELQRELSKGHPLFGRSAQALAQRNDRDDVLFLVRPSELVVVHLTWRGAPEPPSWPSVVWSCPGDDRAAFATWSAAYYDPID